MKIIYVYKKNLHGVITAAYRDLKLDIVDEFKYIDNIYTKEGHFYYLGIDEKLNQIYLLNSNKSGYMLENLLNGLAHIYNDEIKVINPKNK